MQPMIEFIHEASYLRIGFVVSNFFLVIILPAVPMAQGADHESKLSPKRVTTMPVPTFTDRPKPTLATRMKARPRARRRISRGTALSGFSARSAVMRATMRVA